MKMNAFVIMSFKEEYDQVYHQAIRPALAELGYDCKRADDSLAPKNISAELVQDIINADVVIADISEPSPNVFYELGVSHSVGNKTIIITSRVEAIPFDIKTFRCLAYEPSRDRLRLLKSDLTRAVMNLRNTTGPTNLVQEAGAAFFSHQQQIRDTLALLTAERQRMLTFKQYLEAPNHLQDNTVVAQQVAEQVVRLLLPAHEPVLIAICGAACIGKTSFAGLLAKTLVNHKVTASILSTDSYMMSRAEKLIQNIKGFDPRSHDLDEMRQDIVMLLRRQTITVRPYDHATGDHGESVSIKPADVIIVEGVQAFDALTAPLTRGLRYFIYGTKSQIQELKFISDFTERGYDIHTAFAMANDEYASFREHTLPMLRTADFVIEVDGYWRFKGPTASHEFKNAIRKMQL